MSLVRHRRREDAGDVVLIARSSFVLALVLQCRGDAGHLGIVSLRTAPRGALALGMSHVYTAFGLRSRGTLAPSLGWPAGPGPWGAGTQTRSSARSVSACRHHARTSTVSRTPSASPGLWTTEDVTIDGRVHRTEHARIEPKPNGTTPIWLGTYGHRALEVTGRLADGWIPSLGFAPPDAVDAMREEALAAAKEAGRDPGQIACVYNVEVPGSMTARRSEPRSSRVPPAPSSNGC